MVVMRGYWLVGLRGEVVWFGFEISGRMRWAMRMGIRGGKKQFNLYICFLFPLF